MTNIRKKESLFALALFIKLNILLIFPVSGPLMTCLLDFSLGLFLLFTVIRAYRTENRCLSGILADKEIQL